ncbi:hypothetical protein P4O66_005461, partial [Electrophorus voltai]
MPGKGKKKKGKKGSKHPPTALARKPYRFLGTLPTPTVGESGPVHNRGGTHWTIWGGLDSTESYRDQPDYENRHSELDSAESCEPYMDYYEGYAEYGEREEYSDISLRSDLGSDYAEDPSMEVEEVLYGDSPTDIDAPSVSGTYEAAQGS